MNVLEMKLVTNFTPIKIDATPHNFQLDYTNNEYLSYPSDVVDKNLSAFTVRLNNRANYSLNMMIRINVYSVPDSDPSSPPPDVGL